jgi:hypothetical protein
MRLTETQRFALGLVAENKPCAGAPAVYRGALRSSMALYGRNRTLRSLVRLGLVRYKRTRRRGGPYEWLVLTASGKRELEKAVALWEAQERQILEVRASAEAKAPRLHDLVAGRRARISDEDFNECDLSDEEEEQVLWAMAEAGYTRGRDKKGRNEWWPPEERTDANSRRETERAGA